MNAKEWTNLLINSSNDDELKENISKCFESLCNDVHTLVSSRHCKSKSATESCIKDVNQKWRAIVRAFNKYILENPVSFSKITLENMDFRNYFEDLNFVYSKHLNDNYNNSNNTQNYSFIKLHHLTN